MPGPERTGSLKNLLSHPYHGLFEVDLLGVRIGAASALNWEHFIEQISQVAPDCQIVVSPELMTFAGQLLGLAGRSKGLIDQRLEQVKTISQAHPGVKYLIGTVAFNYGRPSNSAVVITDGQTVAQTDKRSALPIEMASGLFINNQAPPFLVSDTNIGVLICSDLQNSREPIIKGVGQRYVHPEARAMIIMSCWGVGGVKKDILEVGANEYYDSYLKAYVATFFCLHPHVQELLVVDRLPTAQADRLTPTHPFNYRFSR